MQRSTTILLLLATAHIALADASLSVADFEEPIYGLKRQGTAASPKEVPLIVIAWQPKGKGEPGVGSQQT